MNNKGEFYVIAAIVGLFLLIGMMVYYDFYYKNPCLERVAKDICDNNKMSFDKLDWLLGLRFICKEDIHNVEGEIFIFTKEELKGGGY